MRGNIQILLPTSKTMQRTTGHALLYGGIGGTAAFLAIFYLYGSLFAGGNGAMFLTVILLALNGLVVAGAELIYRRR